VQHADEAVFRWLDNLAMDELARGSEPSIQIQRGDDGLQRVGKQGGLLMAAAMRLSAAQQKHGAELHALRHLSQMSAADQRGAQAGEIALAQRG
jgi:hypothetical protein